jgi:hypothetical protein
LVCFQSVFVLRDPIERVHYIRSKQGEQKQDEEANNDKENVSKNKHFRNNPKPLSPEVEILPTIIAILLF